MPTAGSVVSGAAAISSPSATSVLITQSSPNAIVNWSSFSIGAGNAVRFENGSGATLNRVTGLSRSQIDGALTATGSVYLVNPNGITVGPTGTITTGGSFVASTHDVSDAAFMAGGDLTFRGTSTASVINYGSIGALGGDVALIARTVENAGTITAPNGTAALAAGYEVLVRDSALSDGKFVVKVGGADTQAKTSGVIKAAEVELRANGGNVYALAGNTSSITKATGVASKGGRIFFTAGDGGSVEVSQKVAARGASANGKAKGGEIRVSAGAVKVSASLDARGEGDGGGTIVVTGRDIALASGADLDVSGTTGGTLLVGGDFQGGKDAASKYLPETVATARTTTVAADAVLRADGSQGAGGKVVVWSDQATSFAGSISATGLTTGGDAEVSGKALLDFTGTADLRGASGAFGTLLLDPYNITISNGSASNSSGVTPTGDDSVITVATLVNALSSANVTVTTGGSGSAGSQAGNITVADAVSWSSGSTLTLSAYGNIAVNANLSGGTGSSIVLQSDNSGTGTGTVTFGAGVTATASGGVSIFYNPTSYASPNDYSSTAGASTTLTAYMLVNTLRNLQDINTNLAGTYALSRDIDATATSGSDATAGWGIGAGLVPIGDSVSPFTGTFDGQGHVISELTINWATKERVGLFGYAGLGSIIRNVGLVGGRVTGSDTVGALVGYNNGTITRAYATSAVTGWGNNVGGLVGINNGTITQVYATGSVTGQNFVGGLVGQVYGGTITQAYATGAVTGQNLVGGLAGNNYGTITASFFDTQTTGQANGIGGGITVGYRAEVTGLTTAQARQSSSYTGWDFTTDWYQSADMRPIGRWEAAAVVNGVATVSNLHQLALIDTNRSGSYVLAANLDASATAGTTAAGIWGTGGFVPIGPNSDKFTGTFDGKGHVISGLTIDRQSEDYIGLFGAIGNGSTIRNVGLVGGSVKGGSYVGGLVGYNNLGTITQAYATGSVAGSGSYVGGLNGYNGGTITQAYATGSVAGSRNHVGGLVGLNYGTSTQAYGTITQAYATGLVTGTGNNLGGLVGYNNGGTITQAYATGSVAGSNNVGGLVGINTGTITYTYATGLVTGTGDDIGGLVGYNTGGTITQAYATGSATGSNNVGGLVGINTGAINYTYATGLVTGTGNNLGGLVGYNNEGTITKSFWNKDTTGRSVGVAFFTGTTPDVTGLTTAQTQNPFTFIDAGWDFAGVWGKSTTGANGGYMMLRALSTGLYDNYVKVSGDTSKVYGDANPSTSSITMTGVGTSNVTLAWGSAITTQTNAGAYNYSDANVLTATSGSGGTTYLDYGTGKLTVSQRAITVTADSQSMVYGDSLPTLTYVVGGSGLVNGDSLAGALASAANSTSNVGTYGITQGTLAASANYTLTSYTGANVSVTARPLTVTADGQSMVYGNAVPTLTYTVGGSGLVNGDSLTGGLATTASSTSNVGTYGITQGTLAASANYALTYTGANVAVTARPLTVTADGQSMVYGNSLPSLTYVVGGSGLVNGDSLTGALATTASSTANVGTYGITQGTLAASGNYALTYTGANVAVTARPITVTADGQSMVYGNSLPTLTYVVGGSGLVNGDSLAGALATFASSSANVGTYGITQGTLANSNYALTYTGANVAVTARPITVTADGQSMVYGNSLPTLTYVVGGSGLVNGDSLTGALATLASSTANVGTYGITQGTLAASGNYALTYTGANVSVTARPLTVTADGQSMIYGNSLPTLTYMVGGSGLVNGDSLTGALATLASSTANVGTYGTTQGTLAASANYALTYTGANVAVTARPLTVTADGQSMVYGNSLPALTYVVGGSGLVNGDSLTGTLATLASSTSNVGTYGITQGTLAASANYALTYTGANVSVTARPLTVTADGQSMIYGNSLPTLTYMVGGSGLVNGDSLTGALATTASSTANVGIYGITQGTLANSNYAITYTGANVAVTARPLTVTADGQSMVYGNSLPTLTYGVGGSGLVNGDSLTGALTTTASSTSNVGTYGITQGTLAASANYALTYTGANVVVTARPLTVTADGQSMVYG
ncbi:MBG domain-containing protein, partial [Azorhizobium sp. AG788]|uniref:MBG domain-containing protein n=1 Tax=Azorhizobium sp. AG788 TaxID=2183897 RepID=UPI00313930D5